MFHTGSRMTPRLTTAFYASISMISARRRGGWIAAPMAALLMALSIALPSVGCGTFKASRLSTDTPTDFSKVVADEPPIPIHEERPDEIPPEPADLRIDRPEEVKWNLSLEHAICRTLSNNTEIAVSEFLPQQDVYQIVLEDSVFDGRIQLGGGWRRESAQILNTTQGTGGGETSNSVDFFQPPRGMTEQFRLSKSTRTGGLLAVQFGTYYQFTEPTGPFLLVNPSVRSSLNFELLHPLFRGHGREVNTIKIRIARHQHHASIHRFKALVQKKVNQTMLAYWGLYGAIAQLVAQDQAVNKGRETWEKEKERLELGESATPQVAEARVTLEFFRSKQSGARKAVADAERELRLLMGMESEDGRRIVPDTPPVITAPEADWEYGVLAALNNRPEIPAALASIESAKLRVDATCDGLRPNVQAYASWAINGAGGKFHESLDVIGQNRYTSWSMGFNWDHYFHSRSIKAQHDQSLLGLSREHKSLEMTRQAIFSELHEGYQGVVTSWHTIQQQRARRESAAHVLESRKAMYEVGEISLDSYLRGLADWSISMSDEKAAIATYNRSLVRWEYAMGTILENHGIEIEGDESNKDNDEPAAEDDAQRKFLDDYMKPPESRAEAGIEEKETPKIHHEGIPLDELKLLDDPVFNLPDEVMEDGLGAEMLLKPLEDMEVDMDSKKEVSPKLDGTTPPTTPPTTQPYPADESLDDDLTTEEEDFFRMPPYETAWDARERR